MFSEKLKKIIAICILSAILLVASAFHLIKQPEGCDSCGVETYVYHSSINASVGDSVRIPIFVRLSDDINSVGIDSMVFDTDVLKIVDIEKGSLFSDVYTIFWQYNISRWDGQVDYVAWTVSKEGITSEDGIFCVLVFEAISFGSAVISLNDYGASYGSLLIDSDFVYTGQINVK